MNRNVHIPKISIIVPVYNVVTFLPKCIDGILNQTFEDFELLLIDDGASDGSAQLCDEYALKDCRVHVFHKENGGVSSARNFGIRMAKGDYLTMIDADDYVDVTFLADFGLERMDGLDLSMQGYVWESIIKGTSVPFSCGICERIYQRSEMDLFYETYENGAILNSTVCKLYRTQIVQGNKLCFDENISLGEDHLFVLDYLAFVTCARVSARNGYHYVKSEGAHLTSRIYSMDSIQYYYNQVIEKRNVFMRNNGIVQLNTPGYNSMFFEFFFLTVNGHIQQSGIAKAVHLLSDQKEFWESHREIFETFRPNRFAIRLFVLAMRTQNVLLQLCYVFFMKYILPFLRKIIPPQKKIIMKNVDMNVGTRI